MKRAEIVAAAKLLGVKASGKNDEILAAIQARLEEIQATPRPVRVATERPQGVKLSSKDAKPKDNRRGLHPITGEVIYK